MRPALLIIGLFAAAVIARADEISVEPGDGTISAAASKAHEGDVLVLAPGEYRDSVVLPKGVSLTGAGADQTTLIGTGFTAISCAEGENTIARLTIRSGEENNDGIASHGPVRIERVRFVDVLEAVSIESAPMSDVIFCEFNGTMIGVRAVKGASPTVWGCVFRDCGMGVFNIDGAAYVRNSVFVGCKDAIVTATGEMPIIRNCAFLSCGNVLHTYKGQRGAGYPSFRNNIIDDCESIFISSDKSRAVLSHSVMFPETEHTFQDTDGNPLSIVVDESVVTADVGASLDGATLTFSDREPLDDKGIRLCNEPEGTVGNIGPDPALVPLGVGAPDVGTPALRYIGSVRKVNCVHEEYLYLGYLGDYRMVEQSLTTRDGVRVDEVKIEVDDELRTFIFDINRFFGEMVITP